MQNPAAIRTLTSASPPPPLPTSCAVRSVTVQRSASARGPASLPERADGTRVLSHLSQPARVPIPRSGLGVKLLAIFIAVR